MDSITYMDGFLKSNTDVSEDVKKSLAVNIDNVAYFAQNVYRDGFQAGLFSKKDKGDPLFNGVPNVNFSLDVAMNKDDSRYEEWTKQRMTQGFDDTEIWNLGRTLCKFLKPRLEYYKEHHSGYPANRTQDSWMKQLDTWLQTLNDVENDAELDHINDKDWNDDYQQRLKSLWEVFTIWD